MGIALVLLLATRLIRNGGAAKPERERQVKARNDDAAAQRREMAAERVRSMLY